MEVLNKTQTTQDFEKIIPRIFVANHLKNRRCIDFEKIDSKRFSQVNSNILRLFYQLINSQGISDILLWYKSQNWLLYLYRDTKNLLHFYGCNKHIDHHSSNIEWIIKPLLQKMLKDSKSKKILFDNHSLSLVGFGILPLFRQEVNGNVYQGFDNRMQCNVKLFQVSLTNEQVSLSRKILKLIK